MKSQINLFPKFFLKNEIFPLLDPDSQAHQSFDVNDSALKYAGMAKKSILRIILKNSRF